jgi:tripartite-type tricarboxylate transporter receptor subunit TctC
MPYFLRRVASSLVTGIAVAIPSAHAAYPDRPIRLIVPFAPGGTPDVAARLLADRLSPRLGVPMVVQNVPGADGTMGVDRVTKTRADGYTLVLSEVAALVRSNADPVQPPHAPLKDLAPISQVVSTPNVLVVGKEMRARTLRELLALVRTRPGAFICAHVGAGTSSQRACDLLAKAVGSELVQVPYNQSPLPDLVAGRVQIFFGNIATAMPLVREGQLKALAVTSLERSPMVPELPTMTEAGLTGFEAVAWFALLAPAGTPRAVVQRLSAETQQTLLEAPLHACLLQLGVLPLGNSSHAVSAMLKSETARWPNGAAACLPKSKFFARSTP